MESKHHKGLILTITLLVLTDAISSIAADNGAFTHPKPIDYWFGLTLPKEPRPGFYKFLGECVDKTTRQCGAQIFNYIFKNTEIDQTVCCPKILDAGYGCNRALTYILPLFDKFKSRAAIIATRGDAVFNQCSKYRPPY